MTSFKLCLSESHFPAASLEEHLRLASEAGFTCIDLWSPKLDEYLATYPIVWLEMKLREHHVYPAAISGVALAVRAMREEDLVHQAHFLELCTHMDTLGGGIIVVHPVPQPGDREATVETAPAQIVPWMARALRAYSDLAAPFDVQVALEFRADAHSSVRTLAAGQEIVRQTARSNVGLALNTLHMGKSGVKPEELDALDAERLKLVHLEAPLPTDQSDRTFPPLRGGEGESLLQASCETLAAQGFRGPYCIKYPTQQETAEHAPGGQVSSLERVLEAKQAALDLLTPLHL